MQAATSGVALRAASIIVCAAMPVSTSVMSRGGLTRNGALGKNRDVAGRALALIGTRPILERTGPCKLVKDTRALLCTAYHMKTQTLSIGTTGSQVRQLRQLKQKLTRHAHGLVKATARAGAANQRIKRVQAEAFRNPALPSTPRSTAPRELFRS